MILRHELDLIFKSKDKSPIPESNPCWEWIAKQFKETAERLKEPSPIYVDFYLYRDKTLTFTVSSDSDHDEEDFVPSEQIPQFSLEEIMNCREIANHNDLLFSIINQPINSNCEKVIQFIY